MMAAEVIASIIIPMCDEERFIGRCLDTVLANDFPPHNYEIIVVDGESTDRSREMVLRRAEDFPGIRLLHNPDRFVPSAMNRGIRAARGRYIIRMDAHSEYPPDYIRNCIEELERRDAANVGGRWITRPGSNTAVARAIALLTQTRIAVGNAAYRLGDSDRWVDTVPFGAYRREIFDQVGMFREDLIRNQDYELNARIRKAGGRIFLSHRIFNTYYNSPTFALFLRQARLNGLWLGRAWLRYPVCFCWRHAAPLALVLGLAGSLILGSMWRPFIWAGAVGVGAYLLAIAATAFSLALREGWQYAFLMPALLIPYHLTYGTATIAGLLTAGPNQPRRFSPCQ